jgi:sugar lactone lactonase YvrE
LCFFGIVYGQVIYPLFAGNGFASNCANIYPQNGVAPTSDGSFLCSPVAVTLDASGNIYVGDIAKQALRKLSNNQVTTVTGYAASSVLVDSQGNVYFVWPNNNNIQVVSPSNGRQVTFAGAQTYNPTYGGDGGPAALANINNPKGMIFDNNGNMLIADYGNNRIRKVSGGIITTIMGDGTCGNSGSGPAINATFCNPSSITIDSTGKIYIVVYYNSIYYIRKISADYSTVTTFGGGGGSDGSVITAYGFGSSRHLCSKQWRYLLD